MHICCVWVRGSQGLGLVFSVLETSLTGEVRWLLAAQCARCIPACWCLLACGGILLGLIVGVLPWSVSRGLCGTSHVTPAVLLLYVVCDACFCLWLVACVLVWLSVSGVQIPWKRSGFVLAGNGRESVKSYLSLFSYALAWRGPCSWFLPSPLAIRCISRLCRHGCWGQDI